MFSQTGLLIFPFFGHKLCSFVLCLPYVSYICSSNITIDLLKRPSTRILTTGSQKLNFSVIITSHHVSLQCRIASMFATGEGIERRSRLLDGDQTGPLVV